MRTRLSPVHTSGTPSKPASELDPSIRTRQAALADSLKLRRSPEPPRMFSTLVETHPSRYSCDGCGDPADVWTDQNEPMCRPCLDWERQAYRSGPAQEEPVGGDAPVDKCCEGLGRYHTSTCPRMAWLARAKEPRPCRYPECECDSDQACAPVADRDDDELYSRCVHGRRTGCVCSASGDADWPRPSSFSGDVMTDLADSSTDQLGREPPR